MHISFLAPVPNLEVEVVSGSSVRLTWDRISLPEITGYIVYYRMTGQQSQNVTVSSTVDSVVIAGLERSAEYQFQVAARAEQNGEMIEGTRSKKTMLFTATEESESL